jgi:outer membrane protein OmpA-like peptidoglycan-associated protein
MPHRSVSSRPTLRRVLAQAAVISLIPIGTAFAQTASYVRILRNETPIKAYRLVEGPTLMTAASGTVLEVVHTRGDLYAHRDDNWYWVLLPADSWGTQRLGWVSGSDSESAPAPPRRVVAAPETTITPARRTEPTAPVAAVVPAAAPVVATNVPVEPVVSEVILHFAFAKSDLLVEARSLLDAAVEKLKAAGQGGLSLALAGHADWTGPESYNDKLGLARAEAVKRYLAEQHKIPVEKISVVSHGENQPAVPNNTRDGRAQNRRVVVKVGS